MKFCPECGSLMLPKKHDSSDSYYGCACGYSEVSKETTITTKSVSKKPVTVEVETTDSDERLPVCEIVCEKCSNKKAYYWDLQTRASDEPPTRFFKCTACKHTWREY